MAATRKRAPAARKSSRKAPAKRRTSASAGKRRRSSRRAGAGVASLFTSPLARMPVLEQRHRDILGLAVIAFGVFMGFVLYGSGGHAGGRAGHAVAVAFGWLLGRARIIAPVALVLGGGVLLLRPVLPAVRPLRTGSVLLFAAITLALAAGTLGLSSGATGAAHVWSSAHLQSHGGVLGQGLYELSHRLVQDVGVSILVVFLALAAVILLTGASLAGVLRATGNGLLDTTRVVRSIGERRPPSPDRDELDEHFAAASAILPPEGQGELIVRATHVEAPSRDWSEPEAPEEPVAAEQAPADWEADPEPEPEAAAG
ncbi:MAG: hypothetical protein H0X28_07635, partial [Solirubrobacterales bacterium]|nr:hypothetical protein [Solirubrobacterales bacterium]